MTKTRIMLSCVLAVALAPVAFAEKKADDAKGDALSAVMKTDRGDITIELYADKVPLTVANFVNLAKRGYYDGLTFHRVIADFMVQGGDPTGTGSGGPGYRFEDEFDSSLRHKTRGILSMANAGPNTNGSQFFITHKATRHLDNKHSVFGKVVSGQRVVDSIKKGDKLIAVVIEGDTAGLEEKMKDRIAEWNAILDKKFPRK